MTIVKEGHFANGGAGNQADLNSVSGILRAWATCQGELEDVNARYETAFAEQSDDPSRLYALAARQDELKTRSGHLLAQLIGVPAEDLGDVRSKLRIWRAMACPEGTRLTAKSRVTHVAVSALADLERLLDAEG